MLQVDVKECYGIEVFNPETDEILYLDFYLVPRPEIDRIGRYNHELDAEFVANRQKELLFSGCLVNVIKLRVTTTEEVVEI